MPSSVRPAWGRYTPSMRTTYALLGLLCGVVVSGLVIAKAGYFSGPAAAAPGKMSSVSQEAKDSLNKRYRDLVAKYQLAPETDPDAWLALIEMFETFQAAERPFRDASGNYVDVPDGPDFPAVYGDPRSPGDEAACALARKLVPVYDKAGVWSKLDIVASRMRCVRPAFDSPDDRRMKRATLIEENEPWTGLLIDAPLQEAGKVRFLTRALGADMYLAAEKQDWLRVVADYRRMLALSRICTHDGMLTMRRLGIAIGELAHDRAEAAIVVAGDEPPADLIDGLRTALDEQLGNLPSLKLQMEVQRLLAEDTMGVAFDKSGLQDLDWFSRISAKEGEPPRKLRFSAKDVPNAASTKAKLADVYGSLEAWADTPWYANAAEEAELKKQFVDVDEGKYVLLGVMKPYTSATRAAELQSRAGITGLRAALDVFQFREQSGRLPISLAELGDGKASRYQDPYSGKPLTYKPSADRKRFELWAVGYDRIDDGCKLDPDEPKAGASEDGIGYDLRVWPRAGNREIK